MVYSKRNDSYIFLPAAGMVMPGGNQSFSYHVYYWPSSLEKYNPGQASTLLFGKEKCYIESITRSYGLSVRPVIY